MQVCELRNLKTETAAIVASGPPMRDLWFSTPEPGPVVITSY